jgi:hypothetical protein
MPQNNDGAAWARPGAKCVLIGGRRMSSDHKYPEKDAVYTVRATRPGKKGLVLLLEEVRNHLNISGVEPGFGARFFRPVSTRTQEQDVALFQHHLSNATEQVSA